VRAPVQELKLPELGENIDAVEVSAVLVAVGDSVKRDQPVIEVETEKASLEVPAPSDGKVTELLVSKGDQIKVGQVVLRLETALADKAPGADHVGDDVDLHGPEYIPSIAIGKPGTAPSSLDGAGRADDDRRARQWPG